MTRPKKFPGLTMHELSAKTGVGRHTIYSWIQAGLLPKPASSGRGVRYDDAFVERVMTIVRLRGQGVYFEQIRRHFESRSGTPEEPAGATSSIAPAAEHWERIVLLPGLELSYRADGGPVLRRLAAEIWRQFGASPP